MTRAICSALLLALLLHSQAEAHILPHPFQLDRINRKLVGRVVDHTRNHGHDLRIYSPSLCEKRDLYVYLPPCYDPCKKYPMVYFLHGFQGDETGFIEDIIGPLDEMMACGRLPKMIIAAPDASVHGLSCLSVTGTFYQNSKLGKFEDFIMNDLYDFMMTTYPIRPEPEAHILLGASMGGGAAFSKAMKFRDKFRVAVGVLPPLNVRWISCRGRYFDNFDPCCWGWRTDFSRGCQPVGRFYCGLVTIRLGRTVYPLYGRHNPDLLNIVSAANPIEMLDAYDIKPGDLELFVAYGGKDQFNIDAQVESFLHRAREKCIPITVAYDPQGTHDVKTGLKFVPAICDWLKPRVEPYSPR